MPVFKDTAFLYESLGGFWQELADRADFKEAAAKAGLVIKFDITEPDASIWITPTGICLGNQDIKPDITMSLTADTCHAFWKKDLSLPVALAKKKIKAKGNIAKVLKLLPVIMPAFDRYPQYMAKFNL